MARLRRGPTPSGHRVGIIDDDDDLLSSLKRLLSTDGHEVECATSVAQGTELVRKWQPQLVLLDYYMPGGTGADAVREIRKFDSMVQIVLVTGYADEQPARQLMRDLDIQGYHDKADAPERLLVQCDAALKHFRALQRLEQQRRHLKHILDVSPEISQLQPIAGVFDAALRHVVGLLEGAHGILATVNHGVFIMDDTEERIAIRAAMGRYHDQETWQRLPERVLHAVWQGLDRTEPHQCDGCVVLPMRTRNNERGCIVVEGASLSRNAVEPCKIYTRQIVLALENILLYEQATVDSLTGLQRRAAGLERLKSVLRLAARLDAPTSILLIDIDHFKKVNDTFGHVAGDLVLRNTSKTLQRTCRVSDVAVRYGGEEILLVLPATDSEGGRVAAERMRSAIEASDVAFEGNRITVTASVGVTTARVGEFDIQGLIQRADQALYTAKHEGRNCVRVATGDEQPSAANQKADEGAV